VLYLIYQADMQGLKSMKLTESVFDFNYNLPFEDAKIDLAVSPLVLACYLGKLDAVKFLLQSETIDIDYSTDDQ
jgi:hypothetical protein